MRSRQKKTSEDNKNNRYAAAKRYGKRSIICLVIILIVLVAIGLYAFRVAYSAMLPNVVEMTEQEAIETLEDYGLEISVQRDWSDKYEEGLVCAQEPKGGTHASSGDTVTILISKGPKAVAMPDLVSMKQADAVEVLNQSGVTWMIKEEYSDKAEAGVVIQQFPEVSQEVQSGETAMLTISKGKKPAVRIAEDVEVIKKKANTVKNTDNDRSDTEDRTDSDRDTTTDRPSNSNTSTTTTTTTQTTQSTDTTQNTNTNQDTNTSQTTNEPSEAATDTTDTTDTGGNDSSENEDTHDVSEDPEA